MAETWQVIDRIAKLCTEVQGIRNAYPHDGVPNSLDGAVLPAVITIPAAGEYEYLSFGHADETTQEQREYHLLLFVCPAAKPADVAIQSDLLEPFFRRIMEKVKAKYTLESLTGVQYAYIATDTGAEVIEYAGQVYVGTMFTLRVVQMI